MFLYRAKSVKFHAKVPITLQDAEPEINMKKSASRGEFIKYNFIDHGQNYIYPGLRVV